MTCIQTQTLLDAYADHALNPWQASRVRRHLARCAACAAQIAAIQRLTASVQAWRDVSAPATLEHQIAAALPRTAPAPMPPRDRRIARRAAFGLAGIAAAIGAGFWLLPSHPSQPTLAFADVQQAMAKVQVVSWTTHNTFTDAKWRPLAQTQRNGSDFTTWVRRNPPAVAKLGQPHDFVSLEDGRGSLERTAQGNYQIRPNGRQASKHLVEYVEGWIKSLTQEPVAQSSSPNRTVYNIVSNPQQQSVMQNGQRQILFTFNNEIVIRGRVSRGRTIIPEMHLFQRQYTWVDPVTRLVTRIESHDWGDKMSGQFNQRQILVWDDFHYNQAPPPGIFDWSPPPGANVINMNDLRVGKGLRLYLPKKVAQRAKKRGQG